jgi:amidase
VRSLFHRGAVELAQLTRRREVSCREVIQAHLTRIEEQNPRLGAVTVVLRDSALALADVRDRSQERGPLHGVPFTVKEDLDCFGSATTHGLPALRDALPYEDAPAVARLKAAGAIPIARTNTSELGLRLCTSNPLHGRTLNPYGRRWTAGGSSGGDAVAVATGMTPLGLGSDLGGSLRVPAHCCGVATLKPTTGRVAHASSLPPQDHGMAGQAMLAVGPLARSVADLRVAIEVLAGRDRRDPRSVDVPLVGPAPPERRAALASRVPGCSLEPGASAAIARAGQVLRAAGWVVEEALPPEIDRVNEVFAQLLALDLEVIRLQLEPFLSEALAAHLQRLCRWARPEQTSNLRLHSERSRLMRAWSAFFAEYPVVIGPNWGRAIWPADADLDPSSGIELLVQTTRFITPGNVLGIPSLALPMGLAGGLPTSVSIYADLWREDLCLEAAALIESARPPLSAIEPSDADSHLRGSGWRIIDVERRVGAHPAPQRGGRSPRKPGRGRT